MSLPAAASSIAAGEEFAGAARRYMPFDPALRTYRQNQAFYEGLQRAVPVVGDPVAAVRLISGCQDNQVSLDGDVNGLFTTVLLAVWDRGAFGGDYAAFHRDILLMMPPTQSPNHSMLGPHDADFDAQEPFTR